MQLLPLLDDPLARLAAPDTSNDPSPPLGDEEDPAVKLSSPTLPLAAAVPRTSLRSAFDDEAPVRGNVAPARLSPDPSEMLFSSPSSSDVGMVNDPEPSFSSFVPPSTVLSLSKLFVYVASCSGISRAFVNVLTSSVSFCITVCNDKNFSLRDRYVSCNFAIFA